MKTIITFSFACLIAALIHGQSAITINAADMPIPTSDITILTVDHTKLTNPTLGNNQTWDYGAATGTGLSLNSFPPETDPFFTSQGIDVYLDGQKRFNSNFAYEISNEWDFNSTGIIDRGLYVYAQAYGLVGFTGNAADSLSMPAQAYILSSPRTIVKFPFTANSVWKSNSRRSVDFRLKVSAFGLNNTPGKHVYSINRTDSIVGWGKMRIATSAGTSIYYDVLVDKTTSSTIDSFYLGGLPAPVQLLNAFSVTQGQKVDDVYIYNVYRKGQANYFARFFYGNDKTFTNLKESYFNLNRLSLTNTNEVNGIKINTVVFPCPAKSELNISVA
jgi:hypothetical protein